jgi:mannose-6-phosphate isomerase-like protein (cupin superfamily)
MDELDKGLSVALSGSEADAAVVRAVEQITRWGLSMPAVDPLVLDFGLGDFERVGEIEFWIANEVDAGYCGKFLFVFDGQTCPLHSHRGKLETFYLVKGRLAVEYGGKRLELDEGGVLRVETGVEHSFTGIGPALLLEVSRPSIIDDNYFANRDIPIGGNFRGGGENPNR